mmetsp:Transcript_19494/g.27459  ORF Transcript_19494/g.27459 Transcript_19494/m.27459 type:complete len:388 (-) Transcript_19494:142-1305(-)
MAFQDRNWLSKEEILLRGIPEQHVASYRLNQYRKSFAVKSWVSLLGDITFNTVSLDLAFEEACALKSACSRYNSMQLERRRRARVQSKDQTDDPGGGRGGTHDARKLFLESKILISLAQRIDKAIGEGKFRNNAFMAKLDTRSPKDALTYNPSVERYRRLVEGEFGRIPSLYFLLNGISKTVKEAMTKELTLGFIRAQNKALKLRSGRDLIQLFIRSFRIQEDLGTSMWYGERHFEAQIVMREWDEWACAHPEAEFRCFVYKGRLTAATQYFSSCYFPELRHSRVETGERIARFFDEKIKGKLAGTYDSYVIDFLVDVGNNGSNKRGRLATGAREKNMLDRIEEGIKVIELNTYESYTGSGLFSWREDRKLLMQGPYEIRVVEEPIK